MFAIDDKHNEPHYQHQNFVERMIQEVKKNTTGLMDRTNTPSEYWLLCTLYTIALMNVMFNGKGNHTGK